MAVDFLGRTHLDFIGRDHISKNCPLSKLNAALSNKQQVQVECRPFKEQQVQVECRPFRGENRPAWQARQQPCAVINKLGLNGALSKE